MNDEQQTPDDRLRAVLEAITRRGHEGLAALLVRILEGRAPVADGQQLRDLRRPGPRPRARARRPGA